MDSSAYAFIVYKFCVFAQSLIFITTLVAKRGNNILCFGARLAWHCDIMPESLFTLEDVARHNGRSDPRTWIVIRHAVYDVTDYLDMHPGGGELLMEYAGKDGTSAFEDFGHSSDANKIMSSYRIGQLVEKDKVSMHTRKKKIENHSGSKDDSPREPGRRSFLRLVCGGCV